MKVTLREQRPALEGHAMCHNKKCAGEKAGIATSCNGTTQNECNGVWCGTTYSTASPKDEKGNQKNPLNTEDGIEFADKQLGRRGSKEIR